jgi:elongation factor Ts
LRTLSSALGTSDAEKSAALLAQVALPGGDADNKECTVEGGIIDAVARIRENLVLRRAGLLHIPGGLVVSYTHNMVAPGLGSVGVLLGLRSKAGLPLTKEAIKTLSEPARRIAMHVAAARPLYAARHEIDAASIARETAVAVDLARTSGKTDEKVLAKMVQGRVSKFFGDFTLPEQPFVFSDDGAKVGKGLSAIATAAKIPDVEIVAFCHFVIGEGSVADKKL